MFAFNISQQIQSILINSLYVHRNKHNNYTEHSLKVRVRIIQALSPKIRRFKLVREGERETERGVCVFSTRGRADYRSKYDK